MSIADLAMEIMREEAFDQLEAEGIKCLNANVYSGCNPRTILGDIQEKPSALHWALDIDGAFSHLPQVWWFSDSPLLCGQGGWYTLRRHITTHVDS